MAGTLERLLLKTVYSNLIKQIPSTISTLSRILELSQPLLKPSLDYLVEKESLSLSSDGKYSLLELGRKQLTVVMTGGTFDLLHSGHLFIFQQAKMLGDILTVVIATDKTVEKEKKRHPSKSQEERVKVVNHIKEVDVAVIGSENDFMETINLIQPDIIALGYDQYHDEKQLFKTLAAEGHSHVKIIRLKEYIPGKSTTKIMQDMMKYNYRSEEN
jgi:glycerol-3-phosphate cytidylyltransferase/FAD synthetase